MNERSWAKLSFDPTLRRRCYLVGFFTRICETLCYTVRLCSSPATFIFFWYTSTQKQCNIFELFYESHSSWLNKIQWNCWERRWEILFIKAAVVPPPLMIACSCKWIRFEQNWYTREWLRVGQKELTVCWLGKTTAQVEKERWGEPEYVDGNENPSKLLIHVERIQSRWWYDGLIFLMFYNNYEHSSKGDLEMELSEGNRCCCFCLLCVFCACAGVVCT